jgi:hypothetical protein
VWLTGVYNFITLNLRSKLVCGVLLLTACGAKHPAVEDLTTHEDLSLFKLQSLRGTRDGDRLQAQAVFSDTSSILTMEMHFAIGSPTTLESGTWRWSRNNQMLSGTIAARSVMFLGGQDGPPSIGGTYELRDPGGAARYRVSMPVTALPERWQARPGQD